MSNNIDGCRVIGNHITNEKLPFPGRSFAFWITVNANDVQVVNNYAQGFTYPFKYSKTDDSIIIAGNIFSKMECSIEDYRDYYQKYPFTILNQFIFEVPGCASDDPATFQHLADDGDPLAMFRLGGITQSTCGTYYWYERAASLGHQESKRILEKEKENFFEAGCYK